MSKPKPDKPLNYMQKQSIRFVDNGDPPFIAKMKAGMGYRDTKIEDKFAPETKQTDDEIREENDVLNLKPEDQPVVVVLKEGSDMTQEEYDEEVKKKAAELDRKKIDDGKITFKKPTAKRPNDESVDEAAAASDAVIKDKTLRLEAEKKRDDAIKKKTNTALLSFGDDEEEE
uniref:DUF4604 domain-containing protein n=1 Tax=Panagrellus redivivus TaxID=6233 RepID=A0A7E4ZPX3_PANRE